MGGGVLVAMAASSFIYSPAHGGMPDRPLWEDRAYRIVEEAKAELPEDVAEKVYVVPPGVPHVGHAPCWALSLKWSTYACPVADKAVIGLSSVNRIYWTDAEGDNGVWFLIGHELAHLQQPAGSMLTTSSYPRENNADCLAGAFAAEHLGRDSEIREDIAAAAAVMGGGDPSSWDYHGSRERRAATAVLGFDEGREACDATSLI